MSIHSDFEQSPHYGKGIALVTEMLGPQFAAGIQAAAGSGAFAADCAAIALETAFGAVWSRPGLERKQRSLVTRPHAAAPHAGAVPCRQKLRSS